MRNTCLAPSGFLATRKGRTTSRTDALADSFRDPEYRHRPPTTGGPILSHEAPPSDGPTAAVLLARAGWLELLEDLHRALAHDLNGRAAALDAVGQILVMEGPETGWAVGELEAEGEKLTGLARALGAVVGPMGEAPEAHVPRELAGGAVALVRHLRGLQSLEARVVEEVRDAPPFRASPQRALRSLLLLLRRAGLDAREAGMGEVVARIGARDGRALVTVGWGAGERSWDPSSVDAVAAPLGGILAADGGRLARVEGGVEVSWPGMVPGGR